MLLLVGPMRSTVHLKRSEARENAVRKLRWHAAAGGRYVAWISANDGTLASSAMMRLKSPNVSA